MKVAQDECGEAVGTRYFDQGIPSHWIYILAFVLVIIVLLLLVFIILFIRREKKTKDRRLRSPMLRLLIDELMIK